MSSRSVPAISISVSNYLISVLPQKPVTDFGVMARHEGDPVPHEHQFYSTTLKGIFSLDISSVGVFYEMARTGYKNLDERYTNKQEIKDAITLSKASKEENGCWKLPTEERVRRATGTLLALPYLFGGAKQTLHLTDVTPKFIILAVIQGGNHLFMNITSDDPNKLINTSALLQIITDYNDSFLSDVFIGRQEGFQNQIASELENLKEHLKETRALNLLSPKQAVEKFTKVLANFID